DLSVASVSASGLKRYRFTADGDETGLAVTAGIAVAFRSAIADLRISFLPGSAVHHDIATGDNRDGLAARSGNLIAAITNLRVVARPPAAVQADVAGNRRHDRAATAAMITQLRIAIHSRKEKAIGDDRGDAALGANGDIAARARSTNRHVAR